MKFSSTLEFNAVREWSDEYIAYAKLKELIYDIEREAAPGWISAGKADEEIPLLESDQDIVREKELQFMDFIKSEIERISGFYREKEQEYQQELVQLELKSKDFTEHDGSLSPSVEYAVREDMRSRTRDLYINMCSLKDYVVLNYTGFSKILKKHDKVLGSKIKAQMMKFVDISYFWQQNCDSIRSANINETIQKIVKLYALFSGDDNEERAITELGHYLREFVVWERNTIWRDMIARERKPTTSGVLRVHQQVAPGFWIRIPFLGRRFPVSRELLWLVICATVFTVILNLNIFGPDDWYKTRCLAVLIFASMLWALEVFPLYVTAMLIPFLIIVLRILQRNGMPLNAHEAAETIIKQMFTPVIFLLLGGFTIAAALSKYQIAKGMATLILSRAGTNSRTILLTIMFVATFASMWLSNVAAPVLCFSVIEPILRTLEPGNQFAKSLIMGIALASNVGGMVTPISSPQNAIALDNMVPVPSWLSWLAVSIPLSIICNIICWGLLLAVYQPTKSTPRVVPIRASKDPWNKTQYFVILISLITIGLWCAGSQLEPYLGHNGVIGLIPILVFFGTGVLGKDDFNNFLWTVIMLAMGGTSLGFAVKDTELLKDIATLIQDGIGGQGVWVIMLTFCSVILVAATFISHTVSALIILPLVKEVGETIPGHYTNILVMAAALMCSGAMGLPVSGFPNITAVSIEDSTGRPFVNTKDFLKVGVPMSLIVCVLVCSLGYGLTLAFF